MAEETEPPSETSAVDVDQTSEGDKDEHRTENGSPVGDKQEKTGTEGEDGHPVQELNDDAKILKQELDKITVAPPLVRYIIDWCDNCSQIYCL